MKVLILYATHNGVTRLCAEKLRDELKGHADVTLADIRSGQSLPELSDFDVAVLGGSIRMGQLSKEMRRYLKEKKALLSAMPAAFWFCCGMPDELETYKETQLPKSLVFSLGIHCFGGELKPDKLKGMDKWIVKMARKHILSQDFEESDDDHISLPEILPEAISRLAVDIRKSGFHEK